MTFERLWQPIRIKYFLLNYEFSVGGQDSICIYGQIFKDVMIFKDLSELNSLYQCNKPSVDGKDISSRDDIFGASCLLVLGVEREMSMGDWPLLSAWTGRAVLVEVWGIIDTDRDWDCWMREVFTMGKWPTIVAVPILKINKQNCHKLYHVHVVHHD